MRRFLLSLGFVAAGFWASAGISVAQNVHALVVGDISPSAGWGTFAPNLTMDLLSMYVMLHENVPESQLVYRSVQISEDEQSDPQQILQAIQAMRPGKNDTVFFYFTGHGAVDDQGHFLALSKGKLYRKTLVDALVRTGARLVVVITDCCNSRSDGFLFVAPALMVENPVHITPLFRSLMIDSKGVVDINSSSPGESGFFAVSDDDDSPLKPGSIFTKELATLIHSRRSKKTGWDELVRCVSLQVDAAFKAYYPKGAKVAEGDDLQRQQTVYAIDYPGRPDKEGPRTGLVARSFAGQGAIITEVKPESPATQVYDVKQKKFVSLKAQQSVISANGKQIANAEEFQQIIRDAPQIMRIGIRDPGTGDHEYLIRMRY